MSNSPVVSNRRSEVDEKNVNEVATGLAATLAEDTVEAVHQCKLILTPLFFSPNNY